MKGDFEFIPNEPRLYYRQYQGTLNLKFLNVDDLVVAGTKKAAGNVKAQMLSKYKLKDLVEIHLTLGYEVRHDRVSGLLTQSAS